MMVSSALTMQHFFEANYPVSIFGGSFCDLNAFFNCGSTAVSTVATVADVPIGWFGLALGGLFALGALFPSGQTWDTLRSLAAVNALGVLGLLLYSVFAMGSLCLLCAGYFLFSFVALGLVWAESRETEAPGRWLRPSASLLVAFGAFTLLGAWGVAEYHEVRREAQGGGVAARVVGQFFGLPTVPWPSVLSESWSVRSTAEFEDAPIRIVEFGDPLCVDCQLLHGHMRDLKGEFAGRINVAFQFFPLEAACNDVVEKDKHPGACELSYMLAGARPGDFAPMLDEVFENMEAAKTASWRGAFARRWGVEEASADPGIRERVHRLLRTGTEYGKTADEFAYGIRSTPTMIINNRMVIGTLPFDQLRAIFQALVDQAERGGSGFIENWEPTES
jgi:uncharacterized membrane protein